MHQFVEDGLEVDGFVIFILWKRGGKENEWSEVEGVPIELTLLPHADTFKSSIGVIFPSDHTTTDYKSHHASNRNLSLSPRDQSVCPGREGSGHTAPWYKYRPV